MKKITYWDKVARAAERAKMIEDAGYDHAYQEFYHDDFPAFFRWKIAGLWDQDIEGDNPPPTLIVKNEAVLELWEVVPFLETCFPCAQDDDFPYLADILRLELGHTLRQKANLARAMEWLEAKIASIANPLSSTDEQNSPPASFKWEGDKAEIAELGYALLESGKIKSSRAAFVTALGNFFGTDLGKPEKHLQTIQKRKAGESLTPLPDRLKQVLESYLLSK